MADEQNEDPTPGSGPSSPRDPDPTTPDPAGPGARSGRPGAPQDDPDDVTAGGAGLSPAGSSQDDTDEDRTDRDDRDRDDDDRDDHDQDDDPRGRREDESVDEPALVGAAAASRRPVRREQGEQTGEKKGRATRRRGADEAGAGSHRTGPVTFVNESVGELRKVVWPTSEMMRTYFVVVLVFVLFMITVVSLLDLLFGWALLQVFR